MNIFKVKTLLTIQLLLASLLLVGCTSVTAIKPNPQDLNTYYVTDGREVAVTLQSGRSGHLKIDTVSENSISGTDRYGNRILLSTDDIKKVEIEQFSLIKTAGATALTAAAGATAYLYYFFRTGFR